MIACRKGNFVSVSFHHEGVGSGSVVSADPPPACFALALGRGRTCRAVRCDLDAIEWWRTIFSAVLIADTDAAVVLVEPGLLERDGVNNGDLCPHVRDLLDSL